MKPYFLLFYAFLLICLSVSADDKQSNYSNTPQEYLPYSKFSNPYKRFFDKPLLYHGYGRHKPEPEIIQSVKIGFLGPVEQTVSIATGSSANNIELGKQMLQGAQLAVRQANEQSGYCKSGIPYELVVHNDNGLWGASGDEIINLAYKDKVWAILGTIDGANSHIAIRVALKVEIPMINTCNTDPTFIETNIPWVFRCITDDRQMCYLMADFVFKNLKLNRVAVLRANNRYGRIGIDEFRDAATRLEHPILVELNYQPGDTDFSSQLNHIRNVNPECLVTYGDALESALILKQMRSMGMKQWFIGGERMVSDTFLENAGGHIENTAAVSPYNPSNQNEPYLTFCEQYENVFHEKPGTYAVHAYDGMNMLIQSIEKAGLNRAKIRDELANFKTYSGASGMKVFNEIYNNISSPYLAVFKENNYTFYSKDEVISKTF